MKKRFLVGMAMMFFALSTMVANALIIIPIQLTTITKVNINPTPFYTQIPGALIQPIQTINYTLSWKDSTTIDGVTEQIIDATDAVVYEFGVVGADMKGGSPTDYTLTWNGKYNVGAKSGQYVTDGMYRFKVVTADGANYTSDAYGVYKTVASAIASNGNPPSTYYSAGGTTFDVNYKLTKNSSATVNLKLTIHGPANNPSDRVITDSKNADGNYAISWDGKINNQAAPSGDYTWKLECAGIVKDAQDYTVDCSNSLNGVMYVNNATQAQPVLTNLNVSDDPYNPNNGNLSLSYTLSNSYGFTTVQAAVYNVNNYNSPVKSWTLSNQSSGGNSFLWDGDDSNGNMVSSGSYSFKVWGQDGNFSIIPQQTSFTVNTSVVDGGGCANFTDVAKNSTDCDAVTYVKSIGAMTGNPNGTFDPYGNLQRDQIAKISLETFNLFVSNYNYCSGGNPFPDVTSSAWSYQYICRGKQLDMITGYKSGADAGYYRPSRSVNRAEFLALILRNLNDSMPSIYSTSYNDIDEGQWFSGYAKYSYDHSLFEGQNLYPTSMVMRIEVARVLYTLHQQGKI